MLASAYVDSPRRRLKGQVAPFVQVLDESMCVIREDICDWLQRYLFSKSDVPPLSDAADLLERLKSGLWLARLAYKLHYKVLATNLPPSQPQTTAANGVTLRRRGGQVVTSREHRLYASLRGVGPSAALGQLSAETLPVFPRTLKLASEARLGPDDISVFPHSSPSRHPATYGVENIDVGRIASRSPSRSGSVPSRLATDSVAIQWAARDNISAFLTWCRDLGLAETILFETTGLVHRTEEKNVLLTLMDLARIASRFGLCDLPELVKMEREIEALEAKRSQETGEVSTKNGETQIDHQEYVRRLANNKLLSVSPSTDTVSDSALQSSGDHDNSSNSSLDLTTTATDRTFFSDAGTDSGFVGCTRADAGTTPTNFPKPPYVDSGVSAGPKSFGDTALQTDGASNNSTDAATGTNRFGWTPVKRSTSLADLKSAGTQSAAKRRQGMQSSDRGRGDSALTQTGAGAGVRSVKRAQTRPLTPVLRSDSHTRLSRSTEKHPASNIPVSKLLLDRSRSASRGPPSGPPSKASSGFASRSSSYSDVHRESLKKGACTLLLKFMARIEKMYEEPPVMRSYPRLPTDSQLEAESNSRVTCQAPLIEALLGEPGLVHRSRTGLVCCRALPSSIRALRPFPVRRIRPQGSSAPPPSPIPAGVSSPDVVLISDEVTKPGHASSPEAAVSPRAAGNEYVYHQGPLARPRLDRHRTSGADRGQGGTILQCSREIDHPRSLTRAWPHPPPHLDLLPFYPTEHPIARPRTYTLNKCNGDTVLETESRTHACDKEDLRNKTDTPVHVTTKDRVYRRDPSWLHTQVKKQIAQCTCCNRIHLQRLDEGRYQLGKRIYYMRRFRAHIMVRVGGGWLTLKEFLDRYDPCRQKEGQLIQTTTAGGAGTVTKDAVKGAAAAATTAAAGPTKLTVPAADLLDSWASSSELQCSEKIPPLRRSRSPASKPPVPSGGPKV